jgi:hypothetical protein
VSVLCLMGTASSLGADTSPDQIHIAYAGIDKDTGEAIGEGSLLNPLTRPPSRGDGDRRLNHIGPAMLCQGKAME